jgi:hypothetical protein
LRADIAATFAQHTLLSQETHLPVYKNNIVDRTRFCTYSAVYAPVSEMRQADLLLPGLGIGTPGTMQWASLHENDCTDTRPVMDRKTLDFQNRNR